MSIAGLLILLSGCVSGAVSGTANNSGQSTSHGEQTPIPSFLQRTLRATSDQQVSPSSIPDYQAVGVLVPKTDIVGAATDNHRLLFGLAVYRDFQYATYPAISTDGGAIWRIDGPRFYVAAAQGASVTGNVGTLGTRGAYFWGQGGNFVKITTDEGTHWSITGFTAGVFKVTNTHGTLRTIALGNQLPDGDFQAFLYVSTNSGGTWTLHGQLPNVRV